MDDTAHGVAEHGLRLGQLAEGQSQDVRRHVPRLHLSVDHVSLRCDVFTGREYLQVMNTRLFAGEVFMT